jgi:hypothetical protein
MQLQPYVRAYGWRYVCVHMCAMFVCGCTYARMDVATCACAPARTDACMLRVHKTPELHVGR